MMWRDPGAVETRAPRPPFTFLEESLNYPAFGTSPTAMPIEHARRFASLVGRLTDVQIRAAFTAGGATEAEVEGFAHKLAAKIAELKAATATTTRQ